MAGEPSELRCNGCGMQLEPSAQCVAATCNHIFCTDCAQKIFEADEPCPLCQSVIRKSNVKLVTVLQPSHKCKLMLCGQTPEVIADTALTAINFYVEQQRLTGMYLNHQLTQKMDSIQQACKKKLVEMNGAFQTHLQAKQKLVQAVQERNALQQDVQELQQKYAQKSSQTRKLTEMFKALQAENEDLKRRLRASGGGGGSAGGLGVARSGLPASRVGSGSSRQLSPFNSGPTQMVTTVQHTRATFDLSSPANSGLNLLAGHGSAVAGSSGNNMFGQAAHGGGQRPTTAGGMFAAALGNGSGRGGGGGGAGGALRLQNNASLFGSPAGGFNGL